MGLFGQIEGKNTESAHMLAAGMQESQATELYVVVPNISGSLFWNSLRFSLLAPRILRCSQI
jgi:hypothetical protein